MQYSIQHIAEIVGGTFLHPAPADALIEHILLDSRQVAFPASSLFVALTGRHRDGHEFIKELQEAGVLNFLLSHPPSAENQLPNANYLLVKSPLAALQALAAYHRSQFDMPVIGITGSNGKTVVKEWLFQLLREDYHIVRSPKSFNSQIGVPLSVLQMKPEHEMAIFEAGISQVGEMEKLAKIIRPTIGVFTNLGEAHSEGFSSKREKGREKGKLFEGTKIVVSRLSTVDSWRPQNSTGKEAKTFTWEWENPRAEISVSHLKNLEKIELRQDGAPVCQLPTAHLSYPENAATCWAVLRYLGYSPRAISERMAKLEPVAMRLELKEATNGCTIVNDSYNSDLTSLRIALEFLRQQAQTVKRTVVLSDILQSGKSSQELYAKVAKLLVEKNVDRLIGIGREVAILKNLLPQKIAQLYFASTPDFLAAYPDLVFQKETILLKGARDFGFEKIAERLATQVHQTVLEVNLTALLNNLRVYQSHLRPGTQLMVMVKASAYGSGSIQVAKLLEFQQVDYLTVAYADEGVELRKAGIQLPILVLNPEEATFDSLLRYQLEPEIYSIDLLEKFVNYLPESFELPERHSPAIHLKLDTGMHRLGFEEKDLDELLPALISGSRSHLSVKSIFSHLAASESDEHDDFTAAQISRFGKMYERIAAAIGYRPLRHILNSSGIVRFPEFQMEMVRLGIGLYGTDGSGLVQEKLQTVNTLRATISQIKKITAGDTVGYGRMGKAVTEMRIATISIGYADGLLRRAGNGRYRVLIRGQRAPIFGNVCMDMAMVDVSHITDARPGDEVIIFGVSQGEEKLPAEELANCLETIPYEIFTSISGRVKRVYVQE